MDVPLSSDMATAHSRSISVCRKRSLCVLKRAVDAKINTLESEGKCSPSHGKVNQAC